MFAYGYYCPFVSLVILVESSQNRIQSFAIETFILKIYVQDEYGLQTMTHRIWLNLFPEAL